ncbi:MAG TPA: phospholipase domain-containing protein, partial [Agriterribacter sp.]|nr:phospholipase domain-containing protein [Agriterribacter sp.]
AGGQLIDEWKVAGNNPYHLQVYGPNGFFREFKGDAKDPMADIACEYQHTTSNSKKLTGNIELKIKNAGKQPLTLEITDNAYKAKAQTKTLKAGTMANVILDLSKSSGWYDFSIKINGNDLFEKRYAGRVETGNVSITDPLMGGVV